MDFCSARVRHSFATAAEESMRDLGKDAPIILIRNRGHLTVELFSTVDTRYTVAPDDNRSQAIAS